MEVLKRIIKKHMSFSLGTLAALVMMTGITSCNGCGSKSNTDGKPKISVNTISLQDGTTGHEQRNVIVTIELDNDPADPNQSAIYANFKLRINVVGDKGHLSYTAYDEEGKRITATVESGKVLDNKTLEYFIEGGKNGILDPTEKAPTITFTFVPDSSTTKEMEATFQLLEVNNNDGLVGSPQKVTWKAYKPNIQDEALLEEVNKEKGQVIAAKAEIEKLKLQADNLDASKKDEFSKVIADATVAGKKAQEGVEKINNFVTQLAGKPQEEASKVLQKEAQDGLKEIQVLKGEIDKIILSKNPEVFLAQVKQDAKTAKAQLQAVTTELGKDPVNFDKALEAVEAAAAAAVKAAEATEQLKGKTDEAAVKAAVKASDEAKAAAAQAKEAYDKAVEAAKLKAILKEAQDSAETAKAELAKVGLELAKKTNEGFTAAEAAVQVAVDAAVKAAAAAEQLKGKTDEAAVKAAVKASDEAKAAADQAKAAYDNAVEAKLNAILQAVTDSAKTAKEQLKAVNEGLALNTKDGFTAAGTAVQAAEAAAVKAEKEAAELATTGKKADAETLVKEAREAADQAKAAYEAVPAAIEHAKLQEALNSSETAKAELTKVQPALDLNTEEGFRAAEAAVKAAAAAAKIAAAAAVELKEKTDVAAAQKAADEAKAAAAQAQKAYDDAIKVKLEAILQAVTASAQTAKDQLQVVTDELGKNTKEGFTAAGAAVQAAKAAAETAEKEAAKLADTDKKDDAEKLAKEARDKADQAKAAYEAVPAAKEHAIFQAVTDNVTAAKAQLQVVKDKLGEATPDFEKAFEALRVAAEALKAAEELTKATEEIAAKTAAAEARNAVVQAKEMYNKAIEKQVQVAKDKKEEVVNVLSAKRKGRFQKAEAAVKAAEAAANLVEKGIGILGELTNESAKKVLEDAKSAAAEAKTEYNKKAKASNVSELA